MRTTTLVCLLLFVCTAKAQTTLNSRFGFLKMKQTLTANNFSIKREAFTITNEDADHLRSKAERQKRAGIALMCIGTLFLASAITTGVMSTDANNNDLSNKNLILRGTCLGSAALTGVFYGIGIPLTIVGAHRTRKYK